MDIQLQENCTSTIFEYCTFKLLMIKSFLKHFRINISDIKIEWPFNDSVSLVSSSKYIIELIVYNNNGNSSSSVKICKELKRLLKYSIMHFEIDNHDMESLKRHSIFISLTFKLTAKREGTDLFERT